MTTGELIKLLQEEDPTGTASVRVVDDGHPIIVAALPGNYDGSYTYEKDGKTIISRRGNKVDIVCTNPWLDAKDQAHTDIYNWEGFKENVVYDRIGQEEWEDRLENSTFEYLKKAYDKSFKKWKDYNAKVQES